MSIRYFDLQGGTLAVEAHEPALLDIYARVFDGVSRAAPPSPVCFRLRLMTGQPAAVPAGARILDAGPLRDEGHCIAADLDGELVQIFPGIASLRLSRAERTATVVVAPGEPQRVAMNLGMIALEAALRASGQIPIHAAGLTLPDGRIVMIVGVSGAGKTTTALALCGAGFGLCSDDLMICRTVGDTVTAWGLPRSLKVHRHTAAMLAWAEPLLAGEWSAEDEKALPLARLRAAGKVENGTPRQVAGICLLARTENGRSSLAPVGQTEMLALTATDHVRTSAVGVLQAHSQHLAALAAIIRRLPACRIVAGPDPSDLGPLLSEHFQALEATS